MLLVFSLQERRAPSIAQHPGSKATKGVSGRGRRCCQDWPVQWPFTDEDCARIVRAGESDPQSGSPDLASVTVRVRRASDGKDLESFAATLPVDCRP